MTEFPRLSASCTFHAYDNGGGSEEFVLATSGGRQFKISGLSRRILGRFDGRTRVDQIAADLNSESVPITPDQLRELIRQKYVPLGIIQDGELPEPPPEVSRTVRRIGFPMLLTWNLVPARLVGWLSSRLRFLFSPFALAPLAALIVWAHAGVYGTVLQAAALTPESYLRITAYCILSILFHELGHAAAVSRFGGKPGDIGCGLYLLLPTFYADVSQLWRFPRAHRMVVDLGGVWFQQIAFAAFALVAWRTGDAELLATCRLIDLMVLTSLNPLFHFDGYWLLADYLAIPKLQATALKFMGWRLRRLAGRSAEKPKLPPLGWLAHKVFVGYSLLAAVFLCASFWLVYRYLSSTFLRFPVVAPQAFHAVVAAFEAGDWAQVATRTMALFFLAAFPATALIGTFLLLARALQLGSRRIAHWMGRTPTRIPQGG